MLKADFSYTANESKIIDNVPKFKLSVPYAPRENYLKNQNQINLFLQAAEQSNSKYT